MKKLVVFYSLEGNTKYIAQAIAEEIAADLLELKAVKEINKKVYSDSYTEASKRSEKNNLNYCP